MKIERVSTHLVGLPITTGTSGWLRNIGSKLLYVLVRVDTVERRARRVRLVQVPQVRVDEMGQRLGGVHRK